MKLSTRSIKVTADQNRRHFTIRTYVNGTLLAKYRTIPLNRNEFRSEENNTERDWFQFLKGPDYYLVK